MTTRHQLHSYRAAVPSEHFDHPGRYEIGVQGRLDERWSTWFDGMDIETDSDGNTCIRGLVVDQAALHGVLSRLRDLGLLLLSVNRIDSAEGSS